MSLMSMVLEPGSFNLILIKICKKVNLNIDFIVFALYKGYNVQLLVLWSLLFLKNLALFSLLPDVGLLYNLVSLLPVLITWCEQQARDYPQSGTKAEICKWRCQGSACTTAVFELERLETGESGQRLLGSKEFLWFEFSHCNSLPVFKNCPRWNLGFLSLLQYFARVVWIVDEQNDLLAWNWLHIIDAYSSTILLILQSLGTTFTVTVFMHL